MQLPEKYKENFEVLIGTTYTGTNQKTCIPVSSVADVLGVLVNSMTVVGHST
jgi:hypothetical protein